MTNRVSLYNWMGDYFRSYISFCDDYGPDEVAMQAAKSICRVAARDDHFSLAVSIAKILKNPKMYRQCPQYKALVFVLSSDHAIMGLNFYPNYMVTEVIEAQLLASTLDLHANFRSSEV